MISSREVFKIDQGFQIFWILLLASCRSCLKYFSVHKHAFVFMKVNKFLLFNQFIFQYVIWIWISFCLKSLVNHRQVNITYNESAKRCTELTFFHDNSICLVLFLVPLAFKNIENSSTALVKADFQISRHGK